MFFFRMLLFLSSLCLYIFLFNFLFTYRLVSSFDFSTKKDCFISKEFPRVNFDNSAVNIPTHFVKKKVAALCNNIPSNFVIKLVCMLEGK